MKNLLFTFSVVLLLFFSPNALAQTNVSGIFNTDQTWSLSGSPYHLVNDVQMEDGATLIIEAGVEISFDTDYTILIKGTLNAEGTASSPIIFTTLSENSTFLTFQSANLNNSFISNVQFAGPKRAIQLGNETQGNQDTVKNSGTLMIQNSTFNNVDIETKGYETNAILSIKNSTFINTKVAAAPGKSDAILIMNSSLSNSIVDSGPGNAGVVLENSEIINSTLLISKYDSPLDILNCQLSNSTIQNEVDNRSQGPVKIIDSRLTNTPVLLKATQVEIEGCIIDYTQSTGLFLGIGSLKCSQITGDGDGIGVRISGEYGHQGQGSFEIENTSFNNASIGVRIDPSFSQDFVIINSNLHNNSTYHLQNLSNRNISAKFNWWETTDLAAIENKVYHYTDDINFGLVDYSNPLTAQVDLTSCLSILSNNDDINNPLKKATIYPNPSSGMVHIQFNTLDKASVTIYTISGQLVYQALNISGGSHNLLLEGAAGIYFLELARGTNKEYHRLVKE